LAVDFSIQRRKLISSDWFQQLFPEVRLSDDRNRLDIQDNTHGGAMVAWSVGSSVLGKVGDTLLLDDSVDPQMAASESECKSANSWVHSVFLNRLNNPATGTVIVTGQRLHQMDTFGLLLEAEPLPGDTSLSLSRRRQTQILFCRNQVGSGTAPKATFSCRSDSVRRRSRIGRRSPSCGVAKPTAPKSALKAICYAGQMFAIGAMPTVTSDCPINSPES
jgi:hypothetical protein